MIRRRSVLAAPALFLPTQAKAWRSGHVPTALTCAGLISSQAVISRPALSKPAYLATVADPAYTTPITRISGDSGTTFLSGTGTWGDVVHHEYSTLQAWSSDESLIYLETNKGGSGNGSVFIDGSTYAPLYRRSVPGGANTNEGPRWHHDITKPHLMFYLTSGTNASLRLWDVVANTTSLVKTFTGYGSTSDSTNTPGSHWLSFGKGEGNFSLTSQYVAVTGNRASDSKEVIFVYDTVNDVRHADIVAGDLYTSLDNCSVSPNGTYVKVCYNGDDHLDIFDKDAHLIRTLAAGVISHSDWHIDDNGNECVVGKCVDGGTNSGYITKVAASTGTITRLSAGKYGVHTCTRCPRLNWAVSYFDATVSPNNSQVELIKLDGTTTYRVVDTRSTIDDGSNPAYDAEPHPSISPTGTRIIFASDWGSATFSPVSTFVADLSSVCTIT